MSLIHASQLPDVDIPEVSITDFVFAKAGAYPDRIAVTDGGGNLCACDGAEHACQVLSATLDAPGPLVTQ